VSEQVLHTIVIGGGKPFSAHYEGNPSFEHDGGLTADNLVLSTEVADIRRGLAVVHGCTRIEVRQTPGQTEEQAAIRQALLGLLPEGSATSSAGFTLEDKESTVSQFDAIVNLETPKGKVTVNLARGGEQFPWAAHGDRVIIGPPDGTRTSDGVPLNSLTWNTHPYWVVEALDEAGEVFQLTPDQYAEALKLAPSKRRR
jgi:hypothetical protein